MPGDVQIPWNLQLTVNVNELIGQITNAINTAKDREAFVRSVCEKQWYTGCEQCNTLIFNMQVDHENNLKNILWNDSFNYDGTTYGIWLFGDGEFTNKGDGGYPNWSFSGWFDRASDNHQKILFRTPGAKGTYSESIC